MCMGACVCVWDQTATLGIILGLCLIFIFLKQDVSLIWTIPRTLDWMATASATLIWDYKWASLPIPFLKGELRIMPWPLCLRSSTLLNSRNTILTLCGILLENYFSGSHSGFLLPLLQVWCHFNVNWQVYFLSSTAELWWFPLSFLTFDRAASPATAFANVFVFTVPTSFLFCR